MLLVTVLGPENRQSGDHRATAKKASALVSVGFFLSSYCVLSPPLGSTAGGQWQVNVDLVLKVFSV